MPERSEGLKIKLLRFNGGLILGWSFFGGIWSWPMCCGQRNRCVVAFAVCWNPAARGRVGSFYFTRAHVCLLFQPSSRIAAWCGVLGEYGATIALRATVFFFRGLFSLRLCLM
jgi:hypothetical protein